MTAHGLHRCHTCHIDVYIYIYICIDAVYYVIDEDMKMAIVII